MHCLNLKMTYKCSNHCPFCFSSYLCDKEISVESLLHAVQYGFEHGARELVLSGGEPTLEEDKMTKVIQKAEGLGYKSYILQTNGKGIAVNNSIFTLLRNLSYRKEVSVSFSIHGENATLHNLISRNTEAFQFLEKAMYLIARDTNCQIYTNTVVNAFNIDHLQDIVDMLQKFHPKIIQFAIMHTNNENDLLHVGLKRTVESIRKLEISHEILRTEGIPYCLMYGMESCVGESYWPTTLDVLNKGERYFSDFKQLKVGMRWKDISCNKCLLNDICVGVWRENKDEFQRLGTHPIN